tara:strand:- start:2717 stop:5830 length:3114 start_codon:yes stop_codon:yes gene_type:complete
VDIKRDVLDSAIPAVHLHKIVLETAAQPAPEINPHIDDDRETSAKNRKHGQVITTLQISIDEKFDDSAVGAWLSNEGFTKFLGIRIYQCRSPSMARRLRRGQMSIEEAMRRERRKSRKKILSVKDDVMSKDLNKNYQSVDSDGDGVYEIMYEARFTVLASEPKYLSYHIETFIDIKALEEEYQIDLSGISFRGITSPPIHEYVFYNFDIIDERTILRFPNGGPIWTGSRHRMDDGRWMTGRPHGPDSAYLEKGKIPNTLIHDFRDAREKLQLDLTVLDKELSLIKRNVKIANGDFKLPKKSAYFSEIYLARDNKENCRYFFSIDYGKLAREGTKYGNYYHNDPARLLKAVKIRSLKVVRKRVQELQSVNKLLSPTMPEKDFAIEAPIETVALSGETDPGEFLEAATKTEALVNKAAAVNHGTILEIDLGMVNATGIRHFTGKDLTVNKAGGLYKYGVEIEIEDNTVAALLEILSGLTKAKVMLEQYYAEATQPDNFDALTSRFTRKFLVRKKRQARRSHRSQLPWVAPVGTYVDALEVLYNTGQDPGLNDSLRRLAKSLWAYISPRTGNPQGIHVFIEMMKDAISRLSGTLGISSSLSPDSFNSHNISGKNKATSVRIPIKTFKTSKFFNNIFDASAPKDTGYDYLPYSGGFIKTMLKSPGLSSVSAAAFIKRANLETLKYFRSINTNVNIQSEDVIITNNDTMENSKFSFLSPSYAKINSARPRWLLRRGTNASSAALLQDLQISTQRYNALMAQTKTLPYSRASSADPGRRSINSVVSMIDLLGQQNCIVEHLFQTWRGLDDDREEDILDMFGRGDIEGQQVNTNIEEEPWQRLPPRWKNRILDYRLRANQASAALMQDLIAPDATSGYSFGTETRVLSETRGRDFAALFDLNHSENGLRTHFEESGETNSRAILDLPNQIKNLFLQNGIRRRPSGGLFSPDNEPMFNYNFRMLRKIEVLLGYEVSSTRELMILSPVWDTLKGDIISRARVSGSNLLCRMVTYTNPQIKISTPLGLELPIYDEYFIVKGRGATGT